MGSAPPVSDAELDVLKVLWAHGPATVREVEARLRRKRRRWAYNTILTLLSRLREGVRRRGPAANRGGRPTSSGRRSRGMNCCGMG